MYVVLGQTRYGGGNWIADQTLYDTADDARASVVELRANAKSRGLRESYAVHEVNTDDIDA